MPNVEDIQPLSDFLRDHQSHIDRMKESGRPEVLTVDGKAEVVVMDARAYQQLLDEVDHAQTVRILRQRIAEMDAGEPGIPLDEAFDAIRQDLFSGEKVCDTESS